MDDSKMRRDLPRSALAPTALLSLRAPSQKGFPRKTAEATEADAAAGAGKFGPDQGKNTPKRKKKTAESVPSNGCDAGAPSHPVAGSRVSRSPASPDSSDFHPGVCETLRAVFYSSRSFRRRCDLFRGLARELSRTGPPNAACARSAYAPPPSSVRPSDVGSAGLQAPPHGVREISTMGEANSECKVIGRICT